MSWKESWSRKPFCITLVLSACMLELGMRSLLLSSCISFVFLFQHLNVPRPQRIIRMIGYGRRQGPAVQRTLIPRNALTNATGLHAACQPRSCLLSSVYRTLLFWWASRVNGYGARKHLLDSALSASNRNIEAINCSSLITCSSPVMSYRHQQGSDPLQGAQDGVLTRVTRQIDRDLTQKILR